VAIEAPVDVVTIDVVKRIHPQFAPLNIEPRAGGVAEAVAERDPEFCGCDDVIVRRFIDQGLKFDPEITNPLERREIDRSELAGAVVPTHTASW